MDRAIDLALIAFGTGALAGIAIATLGAPGIPLAALLAVYAAQLAVETVRR